MYTQEFVSAAVQEHNREAERARLEAAARGKPTKRPEAGQDSTLRRFLSHLGIAVPPSHPASVH